MDDSDQQSFAIDFVRFEIQFECVCVEIYEGFVTDEDSTRTICVFDAKANLDCGELFKAIEDESVLFGSAIDAF